MGPKNCWNLRSSTFIFFSSISDKLCWKTSLLVRSEILRLFVNTMTADEKYSRHNRENLPQRIQMQLSKTKKCLSKFYFIFKIYRKFGTFWKKYEFHNLSISPIIDSVKHSYLNVWRSCFRTPFGCKHVNGPKTLLKSARRPLHPIFSLIWDKLSWKNFLLFRSEILRLFVNTLAADGKYSCHYRVNLTQSIWMQSSKIPKTFWGKFIVFSKSTENFEDFEKSMSLIAEVFPKLLTTKNVVT